MAGEVLAGHPMMERGEGVTPSGASGAFFSKSFFFFFFFLIRFRQKRNLTGNLTGVSGDERDRWLNRVKGEKGVMVEVEVEVGGGGRKIGFR